MCQHPELVEQPGVEPGSITPHQMRSTGLATGLCLKWRPGFCQLPQKTWTTILIKSLVWEPGQLTQTAVPSWWHLD